jgi:hypothetical protein
MLVRVEVLFNVNLWTPWDFYSRFYDRIRILDVFSVLFIDADLLIRLFSVDGRWMKYERGEGWKDFDKITCEKNLSECRSIHQKPHVTEHVLPQWKAAK